MRRRSASRALLTALVAVLVAATGSACSVFPSSATATSHAPAARTPARGADAPYFSASSPWNQRVDGLSADPQWQQMLLRLDGGDARSRELYINTDAWTVPVVSGGVPTTIRCRQIECGVGSKPLILPVPKDASPDPRYDGWFTIIDAPHDIAYDLWRARRETDGSISYQYVRTWALDGPGYGDPGQPSARGSGLPLFAGLIMSGELQRGQIDHALAISVPGAASSTFVRPASMTDGTGAATALPEGARLRLRADVVWRAPRDPVTGRLVPITSQQRRSADAVMQALRTYGAIVVDRSTVPVLYAQKGIGSAYLDGSALQGLTLADFQVVGLGQRYPYPIAPAGATASGTPAADASADTDTGALP